MKTFKLLASGLVIAIFASVAHGQTLEDTQRQLEQMLNQMCGPSAGAEMQAMCAQQRAMLQTIREQNAAAKQQSTPQFEPPAASEPAQRMPAQASDRTFVQMPAGCATYEDGWIVNHCGVKIMGNFCVEGNATMRCEPHGGGGFGPIAAGGRDGVLRWNGVVHVSACAYDNWLRNLCKPAY